jgi:hypothetical protein
MPNMMPSDALRLAINVLKDVAESQKMPSGVELDQAAADLHADAAESLEATLADLLGHE